MAAPSELMMTDTVRAVQRAFTLVRLMNKQDSWSLQEIAEASSLAKATAFRLLHTLQSEGYVCMSPKRLGVYRLTSKVQELGAGLTCFTIFADLADPIIISATREMGWPVSFAMPSAPFMRIVSCGMPYIPERSAKPTSMGGEHWMFSSAVGAAYLSRCRETDVQACLKAGMTEHDPGNTYLVPTPQALSSRIADVRATGYALRIANASELNSAMAVPVFIGEWVIGALACSTFPRSLSRTFIEKMLPPLVEAASRIAQACGGVSAAPVSLDEGDAVPLAQVRRLFVVERGQAMIRTASN
ncbi:IclR family transcriptional regulator [Paraburkholderia sediminicola]|uniref:IclR family transcriptional regulator n=1 Tax=Paraburkholderia sediminicola TaxID=458836 RepID=UPI0038BD773A